MERATVDILDLIAEVTIDAGTLKALSIVCRRFRDVFGPKVFRRGLKLDVTKLENFCNEESFKQFARNTPIKYARSLRIDVAIEAWKPYPRISGELWNAEQKADHSRRYNKFLSLYQSAIYDVNRHLVTLQRHLHSLKELRLPRCFPLFEDTYKEIIDTHPNLEVVQISFRDVDVYTNAMVHRQIGDYDAFRGLATRLPGFTNLKLLSIEPQWSCMEHDDYVAIARVVLHSPLLEVLEINIRDDEFLLERLCQVYADLGGAPRNIRKLVLRGMAYLPQLPTALPPLLTHPDPFDKLFNFNAIEELEWMDIEDVPDQYTGFQRILSADGVCKTPNLRRMTVEYCYQEIFELLVRAARLPHLPPKFLSEVIFRNIEDRTGQFSIPELPLPSLEEKSWVSPKRLIVYSAESAVHNDDISFFYRFITSYYPIEVFEIIKTEWGPWDHGKNHGKWRVLIEDYLSDMPHIKILQFGDLEIPSKDFEEFTEVMHRKFPRLEYIKLADGVFKTSVPVSHDFGPEAPLVSRLIEIPESDFPTGIFSDFETVFENPISL